MATPWLLYTTENPSDHKGMTGENVSEIEAGQAAEATVSVGDAPARSKAVWGLAASSVSRRFMNSP